MLIYNFYHRERIKNNPEELVIWMETESTCRAVFLDSVLDANVGKFYPL